MSKRKKAHFTPAFPPDDYKGSVGQWMSELQSRGLWNGEGWHGDVKIPTETWWEILEKCEGTNKTKHNA